ncbi:sel1 repeat family protein [Campylobacter coli]|nr:sel1 repeat family protein [Campylobacter coli]
MNKIFIFFVLYIFSCNLYAKDYFELGIEAYKISDFTKAAEYYKKGCELNFGIACSNIGLSYINGRGVKQNFSKAAEYSEKGCELNFGKACNNLGVLYKKGQGI